MFGRTGIIFLAIALPWVACQRDWGKGYFQMTTISDFPHKVVEMPDAGITLSDGYRLSARVWLQVDALNPVPAVLEYIPYRKRDGTQRDALMHPDMAGHGCGRYAGQRR